MQADVVKKDSELTALRNENTRLGSQLAQLQYNLQRKGFAHGKSSGSVQIS